MLQFKQHQFENQEPEPRWNVGLDRRHVAAYVGLALVAGFAAGFIVSRYVSRTETPPASQVTESRIPTRQAAEERPPISQFQRVSRIVRADVIEVEETGAVRLLGIETPDGKSPKEIYGVHGQRAVSFIEKLLVGQDVRLEFDSSASNKDEAGQTLAYVYTRDGTLVNAEMVKQGFAFVRATEQFSRASDFRGYEREAMQAMRGVWGSSSSSTSPSLASMPSSTTTPSPTGDEKRKLSPLAPSAFGANIPALSGAPATPAEPGVWVSGGDKMYHKSACDFLDKKKRSIPLSQAKSEGFTACSRCYASTVLKAP